MLSIYQNSRYCKYIILICCYRIWKKNFWKICLSFFSKHCFESEKLELLRPISSYNQYFFVVVKVSMRRNFSSTSFFKFDSWAEKNGIYCRRITVFKDMSTKIFIKNEQYGILKFWLIKSCVLTSALIWNHSELYISFCDEVLSIFLKAKNDLWISWKCSLVRPIELKFLPEAYLSRSTHLWQFQPKRIILSGKSFVRRGAA